MIPLPTMNRICKHWNLPQEFQESCDYYFLRNYSDQDFVSLLKVINSKLVIQEYGIDFQVLFLGDAAKVYEKNGELAKRNEPNNTFYWCSFRSMTFEFNGKSETKSFVLVQVDKKAGIGEHRDSLESTASGEAGAIQASISFSPNSSDQRKLSFNPAHGMTYKTGKSFKREEPLSPSEMFFKNGYVSSADAIAEYERIQEMKESEREQEGGRKE